MALIADSDLDDRGHLVRHGHARDRQQHLHADEVFVPDHRLHAVPGLLTHEYDTPFKDEVLYRSAFIPVAALILAGPQLGLAQAALDYVIEKGHKRGIAYTEYELQRDAPTFQLAISKAATLVDTAHLFAYRAAGDIDDARPGRSHDDLRRAGSGADGHRPRRRIGPRSDPRAVLRPRRIDLRRIEPDAADGGATARSPAGTPS